MFCPKCKAEYREGFTKCSDCKLPLIKELPRKEENKPNDPVLVFKSGNTSRITFAKSLLESAGIQYFTKGEIIQNFIGGGTLGTGYNVALGPTEIHVESNRFEEAKELLFQLQQEESKEVEK